MFKKNLKLSTILFASIFFANIVVAQVKSTSPTTFTDKDMVQWDYSSKVIGEDYTIYVHFPPGYDTTKTISGTIYDGRRLEHDSSHELLQHAQAGL